MCLRISAPGCVCGGAVGPWCLQCSVAMGSWSETVVLLLVAAAAVPCSSLIKEKEPGKGKCFHKKFPVQHLIYDFLMYLLRV